MQEYMACPRMISFFNCIIKVIELLERTPKDMRLRILPNIQQQGSEKESGKSADADRIRELKKKVLEIRELLQSATAEELEELFLSPERVPDEPEK